MQRIFWVKNGDLEEVNAWLREGGKVKMIQAVTESITSAYAWDEAPFCNDGSRANGSLYYGDIYAYIVVEIE